MLFASLPVGYAGARAQINGEIMHFSLTADDERRVTEQDFRGRYLMIQFGYTWCPDVCPMELALLTEVLDGPLLVDEYDSTIVVPPDWRVQLDERGNLILEPRK